MAKQSKDYLVSTKRGRGMPAHEPTRAHQPRPKTADDSGPRALPRRGRRVNVGAFDSPFSGVGMEFEPLDGKLARTDFVLHEVGYWAGNYDWNFESVFSPFWRIYYDFEPGHSVCFGTRETPMDPQYLTVIPSFRRFSSTGKDPVPSLWCQFSLDRRVEPSQTMPIRIPRNDMITSFLEELRGLFRGRRQDRREVIYQTGISFILYVLVQPEIHWQAPLPDHIAKVMALIQKDVAAPWSNATLAGAIRMSQGGLVRSFRQWIHETPARYVQRVRIRKACTLLAGSDLSIKQIAAEVGFANRYHFSRVFKDHTGISPARYRSETLNG